MSDGPLNRLYRTEVAAAGALIAEALGTRQAHPDHATNAEALEAAARRVKGAARIVGRDGAATLAGAAETLFADLRRGACHWSASLVATLESAIGALRQDADDAVSDEPGAPPDFEALTVALQDLGLSETPPPPENLPRVPPRPVAESGTRSEVPTPTAQANTLTELFRQECRTLAATLSDGLVALEADPTNPRKIEPLMRAAHSIKGAARIVNCEPAVELAHLLEELLVASQKGARRLESTDFDPMLAACDLLAELAEADPVAWANANAERVAKSVAALAARLSGAPAPLAPTPAPIAPAVPPTPPELPESDRVVRIGAQSLTRLLSLAGESLVEARRLQPFSQSLVRLRKQHDRLATLLEDLTGRAGDAAREQLADIRAALAERIDDFERHARLSDDLNGRLYREVIASRMRPFADGTHGVARMVRDVARRLGKAVKLEVRGDTTDVDRDILDKLEAALGHLLRNALDHGIESPEERRHAGKPETATLTLEARHHAGELQVRISDDGRGVDLDRLRRKIVERHLTTPEDAGRMSEAELLDFLFLPGFTTAERVTDVSGRGVGLDAVQVMAQSVGGTVRIQSRIGKGTAFELHLPITLSVLRAVLVQIAGDPFALPLNRADRLIRIPVEAVQTLEGKPHVLVDDKPIGLVSAAQILELPADELLAGTELAILLVGDGQHQYALVVDGFLGEQDLVVRPLDARLGHVPDIAAAAVLDDGSPVLILDVDDVIQSAAMLAKEGHLRHQRPATAVAAARKRVLVVDDSAIVREAERQLLLGRGYDVDVAVDGAEGLNAALPGGYDLIVSDIDMPRLNGLDLVRALRDDTRTRHTPVVVVSYKDRPEDRDRGRAAGANYYLTKGSFHDGQFLAVVEELIGAP